MNTSDDRHPVDLLAEEFADRIRAGQNPKIEEYATKYPEHADLIRSVFPSIAMVERVSNRADQQQKSDSGRAVAFGTHGVPESLGDFRLVREIGRGGMGVVYEAIQLSLKRHVALKVIGAVPSGSDKQQARFRREAEAAACLHHTHIVPVFGIGEDQGVQYYAMQLIDGVTLGEVIHFLQGDRPNRIESANETPSQATFSTAEAVNLLLNNLTTPDHRPQSTSFDSAVTENLLPLTATTRTTAGAMKTSGFGELSETQAGYSNSKSGSLLHRLRGRKAGDEGADLSSDSTSHPPSPSPQKTGERGSQRSVSVKQKKPLGQAYYRNVAQIVSHVADALQYAHHQGVLHRDIKPANLMLDRDGIVWITDFGLARRTDHAGMTQTGEIVGTLRYMAPEQMRGHADQRTDIFSLGLTLFELLTLQPAIEQPQLGIYQTGSSEAIAKMHSLYPEIPADLKTITLKACSTEASHRYQTAGAFQEDLRRFLEDRPILARRTTRIERLYRWSRRNPTIASLASATLGLLLVVAGLLAIFAHRKQRALEEISKQYNRAEENLREKTDALATVERERARAELNLDLAVEAFDTVVANIASRGGSDSILNDLNEDGEVISMADATLSDADVILLETLLGFFDRFSAENATDLSGKAAEARRRVGDIQHRLGRLDDAERSYLMALEAFKLKSDRDKDDRNFIFAQIDILNDLLVISAKHGHMPKVVEYYQNARRLFEQNDELRASAEGRFSLAKTLNNLAAIGSKFSRDPRRGPLRGPPRGLLTNRPGKPFEGPIMAIQNAMQNTMLQRESEANRESLQLLKDLTSEAPEMVAYQTALAQALRDEVRIARMENDWNRADESLSKAIAIFEKLFEEFPESSAFKYELSATLGITVGLKPNEMPRFMRSMKLCEELIEAHPNDAEYRSLKGQTLNKFARIQFSTQKKERAEESLRQAIEIQQKLADQYPDVLLYQIHWVQSIEQMAEMHVAINRMDLARQDIVYAVARLEK